MKNKKNMKKIKAAAAITAVVLAAIVVVSGPALIADTQVPAGNDKFMGPVTVTLNATDDISGVDYTTYRIEYNGTSGPSVGPWEPYTGPFVVSQPGDYIIHYYSVDKVGNIEPEQIKGFTILDDDVTPPETTIRLDGTQVP